MKNLSLTPYALSLCVATILLAGCGGGSQAPIVPARPASANAQPEKAATTSENLVYVSYASCSSHAGGCLAEVAAYTFPGGQPFGTWNAAGYARGECADESGNVFVTYSLSSILGSIGEILEFTHGGTSPVATLNDPTGSPVACSVDPNSGDLAVVGGGDLSIYSNASGSPTTYSYPGATFSGVSYDSKGNVFVDGIEHRSLVFAKLPKGGNSFENISLHHQVAAGELDWDGTYLTIGPEKLGIGEIYRFDMRGSSGSFVSAIRLRRFRGLIDQYSITGKQIVVAYSFKVCDAICGDEGTVGTWHYPSGRVKTKSIMPYGLPPTGMALSLAQTHR